MLVGEAAKGERLEAKRVRKTREYYTNSGCVLKCRDTPTSQVTIVIPRSILYYAFVHDSYIMYTAQVHSVMHISIPTCFLCFFYNPSMSPLI